MPGNTTSNTSALRRAEVYSQLILDTIQDGFLPEGIYRDVSDFPDGDRLHITTFGDFVLRELEEDQPIPVDPLDSGEITLQITEYVGSGTYMTDKVRDDSWKAAQFDAAIVPKQARAIKEKFETDMLAALPKGQAASNPNAINGYAHRYVASGANGTITVDDLIYAKLALDKANASESRILIVDPIHEATFNSMANLVNGINNPQYEGIVNTGFGKNMRFIRNIMGFDIYISNRLHRVTSETVDTTGISVPAPSGNGSITNAIAAIALTVGDDMETPIMGAWRRKPQFEGKRNARWRRDEYYCSARWGFGLQRTQTGLTILASATNYK